MPYAEVGRHRLYYEVHGDGVPLLCVMGLGADATAWDAQVPEVARQHRTVIFDNRDVGRSSYSGEPYGVRDMAEDTIGLAEALELGRFHLLGLSLGGAIAQEVALAVPDRVRKLILSYPRRQRRDGYLRQLEASSRHEARDRLPALGMPVHVIGAEQDIRAPVWKSREPAVLIPGARLSIVRGAAHAANIERPGELNSLVLDFLRNSEAGQI
jgi:pimeloyl-ACP methyl ester carboxylesterase